MQCDIQLTRKIVRLVGFVIEIYSCLHPDPEDVDSMISRNARKLPDNTASYPWKNLNRLYNSIMTSASNVMADWQPQAAHLDTTVPSSAARGRTLT
jgi:hypothetical protein